MDKKTLMDDLDILPGQIKVQEKEIRSFSANVSSMEKEMEKISNAVLAAISNETKEVGEGDKVVEKKKFSNEISRQVELTTRLRFHKEYREKKESLNFSKQKFEEGKIQLNFLMNRFSATKYMSRLIIWGEE